MCIDEMFDILLCTYVKLYIILKKTDICFPVIFGILKNKHYETYPKTIEKIVTLNYISSTLAVKTDFNMLLFVLFAKMFKIQKNLCACLLDKLYSAIYINLITSCLSQFY